MAIADGWTPRPRLAVDLDPASHRNFYYEQVWEAAVLPLNYTRRPSKKPK